CPIDFCNGEAIAYQIVVHNADSQAAADVVVTDQIDAGLRLLSALPEQGTCEGTVTVICRLGTMASGASVRVRMTLQGRRGGRFGSQVRVVNPPPVGQPVTAQISSTVVACPRQYVYYIPIAGRVQGASLWQTAVLAVNGNSESASLTVDWFAMSESGRSASDSSAKIVVLPGQQDLASTLELPGS